MLYKILKKINKKINQSDSLVLNTKIYKDKKSTHIRYPYNYNKNKLYKNT